MTTAKAIDRALHHNNSSEETDALQGRSADLVLSKKELRTILHSRFVLEDQTNLNSLIDGVMSGQVVVTNEAKVLVQDLIAQTVSKNLTEDSRPDTSSPNKKAAGCWAPIGSNSENKVVMVQSSTNAWNEPGGLSKVDEVSSDTAKREALEETRFNWRVVSDTPLQEIGIFSLFECELINPLDALLIAIQQEYQIHGGEDNQTTVGVIDLDTMAGEQHRFGQARVDILKKIAETK